MLKPILTLSAALTPELATPPVATRTITVDAHKGFWIARHNRLRMLRHSLVLDRPSLQQMGRTLVMRAALWFMTITVSCPQQGTNLHPVAQGSGSYAPACWLNLCRAGGTARSPTRSTLGAF